jgi:DNA-binding CsgD family transcriptional regulator
MMQPAERPATVNNSARIQARLAMRRRQDKNAALLEVIELLYEAVTAPEQWTEALDRTYELFDSAAAHLFLWDGQLNRPVASLASHTYQGQQEVLDYYLRIDPRRTVLARQPVGYTLLCHEHIDEAFVRGNEFFQDYSLRFGRRYLMATNLLQVGSSTSVLAVLRSPRQGEFGTVEKALLERVRPHLARVARVQARFDKLHREAALGNDLMNTQSTCVVAADATARAVRLNQAAEAVLRRGDGLQLISGRLIAPVHAQTVILHRLISQATGANGGVSGGNMIMGGQLGVRYAITVTPLSHRSTLIQKHDAPLAVVTMKRLEQDLRPSRQLIEMFGLTPAEAELAAAVGAGRRLDEIAEERRVSMATVRTQMRALYSKTATSRQAELVHMIASLPVYLEPG